MSRRSRRVFFEEPMTNSAARASPEPALIGEYRIVKEIGRGAMGSIFLARDTLLERDVALKLITAEELGDEAKALFFREARALARVSHPNVVAVHRVGEAEGKPFLVAELVSGSSLEALPKPLPWRRAVTLGIGITRGLAAAHRRKVLHRDIKPANIMLSDEGEPKLVDFGLAKMLEEGDSALYTGAPSAAPASRWSRVTRSGEIAGTPLYMAPETLLGAQATEQSDIYSVGAVLYELVTGLAPRDTLPEEIPLDAWISSNPSPLEERASGAVHPRFARVVARCLAALPGDRFATAEALEEALEVLRDDQDAGEIPAGNPYRGLETFEIEHRGFFYGRETDIRAVGGRLRAAPLVVVAGDSGVGKSSLCKAGVLPRLLAEARDRGREQRVLALVPGRHPMAALESAITPLLSETRLSTLLDADHAALYRAFSWGLGQNEDLVLFVDQLEELCTLSEPAEVEAFGEALLRASSGPRVRVLATLRGDFITEVARIGSLGPVLAESLYLLRPMSEEGIRAAIVKPALRKGVSFESEELVDELVRASAEMPGGLPLLEFALAEVWAARGPDSAVLTRQALRSIGSVSGALARHADAVLEALGPAERSAARRVLLQLTNSNRTRMRRTWEELGGEGAETRAAIDALVRGRLIVARKGGGEERVYEVAHEALLREWDTLRGWIEETRERRQFLQEIEEAAELWARRGKREEETWAGEALAQAMHRVEKWALDLPSVSRAFLDSGVARQQKALRRWRWILGSGATALLAIAIASTVTAIAFSEKEKEAIRQQAEIRLAAADMGEFDLVLQPFDWDAESQRATPAPASSALDFRLYAVSVSDSRAPGRLFGDGDMRRSARRVYGTVLREHVEARSGGAFLEVFGRGEGCASSWIYLRRLPGYTERASQAPIVLRIAVPTCQATKENTVEVPAGDFYRARPEDGKSGAWKNDQASLPAFRIDRTEVTQGAFAIYEAMQAITGDSAARTAYLDLGRPGSERLPIVGIDSFIAANYCAFLGKRLPSADEWLKAMRGGLDVGGAPNPDPRRDKPWLTTASAHPTNLIEEGGGDGFPNLAPVGSFPDDKSPYGVLDLAGNAREWTGDDVELTDMRGLRYVFGASWDTPAEHSHWGNMRPERFLDFTVGVRCAASSAP